MKSIQFNRKCSRFVQLGIRAICVMFPDAVLCGACGALYGLVFGGLAAKVDHDVARIVSIVGTMGSLGLVVGAITAVLRQVLGTEVLLQATDNKDGTKREDESTAVVIPYVRSSMNAMPQNQKNAAAAKAHPRSTAISG